MLSFETITHVLHDEVFEVVKKHLIAILIAMPVIMSCKKESVDDCNTCQIGILKPGLDGCDWFIQLSDGRKFEPRNLEDFNIELSENKQICFQYHKAESQLTYCLIGTVIEIECIAE